MITGRSVSQFGNEAYRWTQIDGMVGLGDLPGGEFRSEAHGVSYDGSVIVGSSYSTAGRREAFRWTQADGMSGLGDLLIGNLIFTDRSGAYKEEIVNSRGKESMST